MWIWLLVASFFLILFTGTTTHAESEDRWPFNYAKGLSEQLSRLCVGIRNSHACAQAIERHQVEREAKTVSRKDRELTIALTTGRTTVLRDSEDGDVEGRWYNYLERLPAIGYHLIHVQFYEGDAYLLVHASTGTKVPIQDLPVLSPDGTRFVTASAGVVNPNALQIWRVRDTGLEREWSYEPTEWEPDDPRWSSPTEIRIGQFYYRDRGVQQGEAIIRLTPEGWKLVDPVR